MVQNPHHCLWCHAPQLLKDCPARRWLNALARHLQSKAIQARGRAQIRTIKGSSGRVEVFQMDGVGISIIEIPRPLHNHDTPNPAQHLLHPHMRRDPIGIVVASPASPRHRCVWIGGYDRPREDAADPRRRCVWIGVQGTSHWRCTRYVALHPLCGAAPVMWRCTRYVALHPNRRGVMPTVRVHCPLEQVKVWSVCAEVTVSHGVEDCLVAFACGLVDMIDLAKAQLTLVTVACGLVCRGQATGAAPVMSRCTRTEGVGLCASLWLDAHPGYLVLPGSFHGRGAHGLAQRRRPLVLPDALGGACLIVCVSVFCLKGLMHDE